MNSLSLNDAYAISLTLLTISTIVSRLELVIMSSVYIDFSFPEIGLKRTELKLFNYGIMICSFLSGILFYCKQHILFRIFFYLTAIGVIYLYSVKKTNKDGSDQIRVLAYFSFVLGMMIDNDLGKVITIGSLGVQSLISCTTSGLTKVFSKHRQNGTTLSDMFIAYSHGFAKTVNYLKKASSLQKFLSHVTTFAILAIPVCFFIPSPYPLIIILGITLLLHFFTAILLGLNGFLFTFPLTYPGILILHALIFKY
ncbi:hypothetical protein [Flavivirga spongiicola]|uniref:HTTM domain-containing protein n=1 Tax=Flavivirga spongiicola TaxID=421621 RepID=A0ABU7XUE4_9FLAO|nr:hypothetical protein [Flavivirga sp. MEBiC05379]MDO5979402.1 hypothetical protein [Flavivirga sp. MEBiC05379]